MAHEKKKQTVVISIDYANSYDSIGRKGIVNVSSERGSGHLPSFRLKATLTACAYISGSEWLIFVLTFWVVITTVARANLIEQI